MSDAAQAWFIAGAVPFLIEGGHTALAVFDTFRPTHFTPNDKSLKPQLERTGVGFRERIPGGNPARPSFWQAWLAFNLSHGVGAFGFGLLALLIALEEPELLTRTHWISLSAVVVSAGYFLIALRFLFWFPTLVTGASTVCFAIALLAG